MAQYLYIYDDDLKIRYVRVTNNKKDISDDYVPIFSTPIKSFYVSAGKRDILLFHNIENLEVLIDFLKKKLNQPSMEIEYYRQRQIILYQNKTHYLWYFLYIKWRQILCYIPLLRNWL